MKSLFVFIFIFHSIISFSQSHYSEETKLMEAIERRSYYVELKRKEIHKLINERHIASTPMEKYLANEKLVNAYTKLGLIQRLYILKKIYPCRQF